jgi:nicotinamidase-related amidase
VLIERDRSLLLMVDVQERLLPAMAAPDRVLANCAVLLKAAARLGVPVLASEQYPKGLGPTVADLRALVPAAALFDKLAFSCTGDPQLAARLAAAGRDQVVICGIEAHVCVLQTALGTQAAGLAPIVVRDATSSRQPESKQAAFDRLRDNRVETATTEMVLFEWLGRAGTEEFRELSRLIR